MKPPAAVMVLSMLLLLDCATGQPKSVIAPKDTRKISVVDHDSGDVVTGLGYGIKVNKDSLLHRKAYTLNDQSCPITLTRADIRTVYNASDRSYSFFPTGSATGQEALTAMEIRIILFDVFGDSMKTLSLSHVGEMATSPVDLQKLGTWYASENEVGQYLTSVTFVARARKASGAIWNFDVESMRDELRKIQLAISAEDLKPTKDKK